MVLDVAGALDRVFGVLALKLLKDLTKRFTGDICQHIESAPVGHANGNFQDVVIS